MSKRRCVVHVDIDAFFAAVEELLDPSLKGKPVIVGGLPNERGVASTASYEARRYGVHSGVPLAKAYQLCPNGIFIRGNHQIYSAFSRKFFHILSQYTPDVEKASLDEAYLDFTWCSHLYPSFSSTAREIKQKVEKELGLAVSVGIGPNKLLAKLATNKAKPAGLVEIKPGREEKFLKDLGIESMPGIGPKAQGIFRMLNIRKVSDLWGLPRTTLRSLFGLNGEELYLQSRGIDSRPIVTACVPKSVSRETTFLEDIWDRRLLLAHLAYLCDRLALPLRKERLFTHVIELRGEMGYFKDKGKTTLTKEEIKFSIIPTVIGMRYKFIEIKNLNPYLGIGVDFYFFKENAPIGNTSDSTTGFHIEMGSYITLGQRFYIDLFVRYVNADAKPYDEKIKLGGFRTGIGIGYSFKQHKSD